MEILENILTWLCVGIVAALGVWYRRTILQLIPPPLRVTLAVQNIRGQILRRVDPDEKRIRIVLSWLANDNTGDPTSFVEDAFVSVMGVELLRSARIVSGVGAGGDWKPAMQAKAKRRWIGELIWQS